LQPDIAEVERVASDIHQLIAAINPDGFCEPAARREVRRILKTAKARGESPDYAGAATKVVPSEPNQIALKLLELENPFRLPGFKSPTERHTLSYDSFDESLEAFYFWLLDELANDGWTVNKLADTFAATPASGLFTDLNRRETQAQREAMKLLREAHGLVRDILRAVSFLKEEGKSSEGKELEDNSDQQLERSLLKSKVESLKLYARWLGPYLRQARQTRQSDSGGAALPNLFNTATAQVTLLAQKEYLVKEEVDRGELPNMFLKPKRRTYYSVLVIELRLRAAPERTSPGAYAYRGRFELTLTSYALSLDELVVLRRELDRENLDEVIHSLGEGSSRVLNELIKQIDELVADPKPTEPVVTDTNPFFALFDFSGWFNGDEKRVENEEAVSVLRPDSEIEAVIRSQAILEARRSCLEFYNRCKHAFKMPAF
jgi:hypothetical protein